MRLNRPLYWLRYIFVAFGVFAASYLAGGWLLAVLEPGRCA